jgi:hypothetical protein
MAATGDDDEDGTFDAIPMEKYGAEVGVKLAKLQGGY